MILCDLEALSAKSAADVAKAVIDPNWKRIDIIPCDKARRDCSILSKRSSVGSFALLGIGLSKVDDTFCNSFTAASPCLLLDLAAVKTLPVLSRLWIDPSLRLLGVFYKCIEALHKVHAGLRSTSLTERSAVIMCVIKSEYFIL